MSSCPPDRTNTEEWLDDIQTILRLGKDISEWEHKFLSNMEAKLIDDQRLTDNMWAKLEELWEAKL